LARGPVGLGKLLKKQQTNPAAPLYNSPRPSHGEPVKRTAWVSLIVLGLALVGPAAAHARNHTKGYHPEVSKQSQKQAKSYNKELNRAQKHQNKMQKQQMKAWQKQHPESHSVTGRG
jgi:hypothetical protein